MNGDRGRVLLTGATGYIGGRLLKLLEARCVPLRCLARRPEHLRPRCAASTEVVAGDLLDPASLGGALGGVATAYYLVHSMAGGGSYADEDRAAARDFGALALRAGVARIVYLGGLGAGGDLSQHLASRHEVGRMLAASGVPTVEFRASIILGSGSLSFEMIRSLVDRLPIMITPRWVRTRTQPIAVEDVLAYLVAALELPVGESGIFEIGGADTATYLELMREYARQRGLRRLLIPVPFLTPRLSSLWLGLVTPLYARVGRALIEGVRNETVVRDPSAPWRFSIRPRGMREAVARALLHEDRKFAETRWSDALSSGGRTKGVAGMRFGSRIVDSRSRRCAAPPSAAFAPIRRIGGRNGWTFATFLWRVRGFLDLLLGGVGLRRGRRDPEHLLPGETVDFWRVEACEPDRMLRLAAEMRLPGRAWLQFEVEPDGEGSKVRQTAIFDPRGLGGRLTWLLL
ncbi:MAG: DUF2867 domain-containing protein [Planctomycetaceae bacterium]